MTKIEQLQRSIRTILHEAYALDIDENELITEFSDATISEAACNIVNPIEIDYMLDNLSHKEWFLFNIKSLDKQRMLEYLKNNIDKISLEDLETIVNK